MYTKIIGALLKMADSLSEAPSLYVLDVLIPKNIVRRGRQKVLFT